MAIFRANNKSPEVLTIVRKGEPCKGQRALPGGYVEEGEKYPEAAVRETKEEVGLDIDKSDFAYICDQEIEPGTDHLYAVIANNHAPEAGSDARDLKWLPADEIEKLAFHHLDFLHKAMKNIDILEIADVIEEDIWSHRTNILLG